MRMEGLSQLGQTANWVKGPNWETKKFDGFIQLQHLDIILVAPSGPEDDQNSINAVKILVSSITTRGTYSITSQDIEMSEISLDKLTAATIPRGYIDFDTTAYVFVYERIEGDLVVVETNGDLHTAIAYLRNKLVKDMTVEKAAEIQLLLDLRSHNKPGPMTNIVSPEKQKRASVRSSDRRRKGKKIKVIDF